MTGADIVGALLGADDTVTAAVPAAQIKGGRLPDNIQLPALLVRTVSVTRPGLLKPGSRRKDRVSVTVRASSWAEQNAIMKLVDKACGGRTGAIAGATNVAVLDAGTGPDLAGPANSFEQAQDFRVSFNTPA